MLALPFSNGRWARYDNENDRIGFIDNCRLIGFMAVYARQRNVIHHELIDGKGGAGEKRLTVFFISDIHRRKIDDKLLRKVWGGPEIDIVIVGGDLAERGVPLSRIDRNVRNLALLGPIYFVWGNNDREVGEEAIRTIIDRHGGKILDNESATIPGHPDWGICGTDDPSSRKVDIGRHSAILISINRSFL